VNLEMRSQCERCNTVLADEGVAFICSYECTFCEGCTVELAHACPNCAGELLARPKWLARRAAS
jgi:uncharacterized protein